ncbi:MAG TPA: DUF58 domain-containing protein [Polyangiaceae bacterium]|jgi:uncharacterized protein (DUF58 family)|nr:DUF58 domain-containing protein [Polyangiaceae bacterium]
MSDLLDAAFVRELELLRRRLTSVVRSGELGDRAAPRRGSSAEFLEHRPYAPGDDLRRIDWLAYARVGQPVTKLFRSEEDIAVRLLLDASASLDHGEPKKFDVARKLAAAVGYMALAGTQRAQLLVARERATSTEAEAASGLERVHPARRGKSALGSLLRELETSEARGRTDLVRAVEISVQRAQRPGFLVVLSDFLDPGPVTRALTQARAAGHQVTLIQVLARDELEPQIEGDFSLEDAETGLGLEVAIDAAAVEAYLARMAGLLEELRAWARVNGASYVRVVHDEPLVEAVRRIVMRTID